MLQLRMPLGAVLCQSRLLHHGWLHKHAVAYLWMQLRVRVGERGGDRGRGILWHGLGLGNRLAPLHGGGLLGSGVVVSGSAHGEGRLLLLLLLYGSRGIGGRGDDMGVGGRRRLRSHFRRSASPVEITLQRDAPLSQTLLFRDSINDLRELV